MAALTVRRRESVTLLESRQNRHSRIIGHERTNEWFRQTGQHSIGRGTVVQDQARRVSAEVHGFHRLSAIGTLPHRFDLWIFRHAIYTSVATTTIQQFFRALPADRYGPHLTRNAGDW